MKIFELLEFVLLIIIPLSPLVESYSRENQDAFALSPSFTRQETTDSPNDWILWKEDSPISSITTHDGINIDIDNAKDISQCKRNDGGFISPDIGSVSHISNGSTLNATVWFASSIAEPLLNDTIDLYQENLQIKVSDLPINVNLEKYTNLTIAKHNNPRYNFTLLERNLTHFAGNNAYKLVYHSLTPEGLKLKNMTLLAINDNRVYDVTYSAFEDKYNSTLPIVERAINSIQFINSQSWSSINSSKGVDNVNINTSTNQSIKGYDTFDLRAEKGGNKNVSYYELSNFGIRINRIPEWNIEEKKEKGEEGNVIIFKSPFSDTKQDRPSWHEITITMAIAVDSRQDTGVTDYRVILFREQDTKSGQWKWENEFREVSAHDKTRVLEKVRSSDIFNKKGEQYLADYALFSLDMEKVNFPQQYRAVFYVTDYFVKDRHFCRLIDTTNWVMVPPPEFAISTKPTSVVLRPGEHENIELAIKGNVNLPSQAFLSKYGRADDSAIMQEMDFVQNNISIPASGVGTSTLAIKLQNDAVSGSYTIPLRANITFPTTIVNRGGESFSNSKGVNTIATSNLTLTLLPPYSTEELFNNFVNIWITPISGLWTFFAGVAAVLAPVIIKLYQRRKHNERTDQQQI